VEVDKQQEQKLNAAYAALEFIKPGMTVGLGTGSTANFFAQALSEQVKAGLQLAGVVATSQKTVEVAKSLGLPLKSLNDAPFLDVTVDGADEFDMEFRLIKGGGGALLIEKMVASSSRYMVTIVDEAKKVDKVGKFPLPIEVVPIGVKATAWKIERAYDAIGMKCKMVVRGKDGKPFRTDAGNVLIDCHAGGGPITEPERLEIMLNNIPGVVNNGLFIGICGIVLMGTNEGATKFVKSNQPAPAK
jgi:ribose 5-phosphate isomerase A